MNAVVGFRRMLGLTLRRQRAHTPAWFGGIAVLLVLIAYGISATYPTAADRNSLARSVRASAGELFLTGPVASTDPGGVGLWRMLGAAQILLGVVAVLTVVRTTRTPEENGTLEMLGGARVGRAAPVAAALAVVAGASVLAGAVVMLGFDALTTLPRASALVGAEVALLGITSAAIAGVGSQVMRTARGASGFGVVAVAACYLLRGVGDVTGGTAVWASPFGWITAVRPFALDDGVMTLPPLVLALVLTLLSIQLAARRDLGNGFLVSRPGRAEASASLAGPVSLALRLSRPTTVGAGAGAVVVGAVTGAVAVTVDQQINLHAGGGPGGLVPLALYLSPMFAAVAGIQTLLRARSEITSGRAEQVLAQPVGRGRWMISHLVAATLCALVVETLFGLGIGLAQPSDLSVFILAAALRVPAAWLFVGIAALLLGVRPQATAGLTYGLLAASVLFELLVEFRILPATALYASPFALAPQLPVGPGHLGPTLGLLTITIICVATGNAFGRRTDLR